MSVEILSHILKFSESQEELKTCLVFYPDSGITKSRYETRISISSCYNIDTLTLIPSSTLNENGGEKDYDGKDNVKDGKTNNAKDFEINVKDCKVNDIKDCKVNNVKDCKDYKNNDIKSKKDNRNTKDNKSGKNNKSMKDSKNEKTNKRYYLVESYASESDAKLGHNKWKTMLRTITSFNLLPMQFLALNSTDIKGLADTCSDYRREKIRQWQNRNKTDHLEDLFAD